MFRFVGFSQHLSNTILGWWRAYYLKKARAFLSIYSNFGHGYLANQSKKKKPDIVLLIAALWIALCTYYASAAVFNQPNNSIEQTSFICWIYRHRVPVFKVFDEDDIFMFSFLEIFNDI